MNEEEKEAIDKLKSVINNDTGVISDDIQDDEIETILGLINKQQKEIVRLRHINTVQEYTIKNSISKDKIKEKIEEVEKKKEKTEILDFKAFYSIKEIKNIEINILKEILGEEND